MKNNPEINSLVNSKLKPMTQKVEKMINCILYENNKIFYNQEEKLYMCDYSTLSNECLLTTLSSNISKILYGT